MGGCRLTARAQVGADGPSEAEGLPLRFSPVLNTALTYQISKGPERNAALINQGFWPLKWSKRNGYLKKACTLGMPLQDRKPTVQRTANVFWENAIFQVCSMPLIETTSTPWLRFSKYDLPTYLLQKINKMITYIKKVNGDQGLLSN